MKSELLNTQDLSEAAAPEEIAIILRNAAQSCYEAHNELLGAWQQSCTPWAKVARILEQAATRIESIN